MFIVIGETKVEYVFGALKPQLYSEEGLDSADMSVPKNRIGLCTRVVLSLRQNDSIEVGLHTASTVGKTYSTLL